METFILREDQEFIELNNLLKVMNLVATGGEAKLRISNGEIIVNDEIETRKRKKLRHGDIVVFQEDKVIIEKK